MRCYSAHNRVELLNDQQGVRSVIRAKSVEREYPVDQTRTASEKMQSIDGSVLSNAFYAFAAHEQGHEVTFLAANCA